MVELITEVEIPVKIMSTKDTNRSQAIKTTETQYNYVYWGMYLYANLF